MVPTAFSEEGVGLNRATVNAGSGATQLPTSAEILKEVRNFVSGTTFGTKYSQTELSRSAIFLLKSLPAARDAVLEFLCTIFDDAVNVSSIELELAGTANTAAVSESDDRVIQEVQDILSGFIKANPQAWAPIVSTWSLDLLGQLSSKHSERRGVIHASSLNEVLQLWMGCRPMRALVDLSAQCVSTLISGGDTTDLCIDALLDTSVLHSPHFDWVVAHIGSCFPQTIIDRVLACGLKDFCTHGDACNQNSMGGGLLPTPDKKVPKIASVVGILGHLAGQHSDDIRRALLALFQKSFTPNPTAQQLATVPFLLQLASMSPILRKAITSDFVKAMTPSILNELCCQIPMWRQSPASQNGDELVTLVVHLILQSDESGEQIIHFLLDTAAPKTGVPSLHLPQVQLACGHILDCLLLEIRYHVNMKSRGFVLDIPILSGLGNASVSRLCEQLLSEEEDSGSERVKRAHWTTRLLATMAIYGKEHVASDVVAHILAEATTPAQLGLLPPLLTLVESSTDNRLLRDAVSAVLSCNEVRGQHSPARFLANLCRVVRWESEGASGFGSNTQHHLRFADCLPHFLVPLAGELSHPDLEAAHHAMEAMTRASLPDTLSVSTLTALSRTVVNYFFAAVVHGSVTDERLLRAAACGAMISKLCAHASAQHLVIRALIEGALDEGYAPNFGGGGGGRTVRTKTGEELNESATAQRFSLLEENQRHAVSITLPQSHSSVFHAGIIGEGLRPPNARAEATPVADVKPDENEVAGNVQLLLEMLKSACVPCRRTPEDAVAPGPVPTVQGMTAVALLLVELVSSDVMFNGLPWPEEEFAKVTIERDLHIKRAFDVNPILWKVLFLVASHRPALCYCSVLLRALAAVSVAFWSSCQEKRAADCPRQLELACKLVDVMAAGQLLPPPLSFVSEIFPRITPHELFTLLADIWCYMRDNVPSPAAFEAAVDARGYAWRHFDTTCARDYTNKLHCIMQGNISKFGHLFVRFFGKQTQDAK